MATISLRIDHHGEEYTTERFLFDCTPRQAALLRRSNRKVSSKDKTALFFVLLCTMLPEGETLSSRRIEMQNSFKDLKELASNREDVEAFNSIITGAANLSNIYFASPYGLLKVLRPPVSILDTSGDKRIVNLVITNDIDISLLTSLKDPN